MRRYRVRLVPQISPKWPAFAATRPTCCTILCAQVEHWSRDTLVAGGDCATNVAVVIFIFRTSTILGRVRGRSAWQVSAHRREHEGLHPVGHPIRARVTTVVPVVRALLPRTTIAQMDVAAMVAGDLATVCATSPGECRSSGASRGVLGNSAKRIVPGTSGKMRRQTMAQVGANSTTMRGVWLRQTWMMARPLRMGARSPLATALSAQASAPACAIGISRSR